MKVSFWLLGKCDDSNPSSIPLKQLKQWQEEGIIKYLGEKDDVRDIIAKSSCIVLPSYKEGIPRTLLEAMSMQKPIITTNVSGCKECISPPLLDTHSSQIGQNGILIPAKNPQALCKAFGQILSLSQKQRLDMGKNALEYAKSRFNIQITIQTYLQQVDLNASPKNKNLAFISNTSFGMYNFRLPILKALQAQGYIIHIIAPKDKTSTLLQQEGFILHPLYINSKGMNPIEDISLFLTLRKILKAICPGLVLSYTIKPAIYGSLASASLKIPHFAIITGLGYVFIQGGIKKSILRSFVILLYKISLKHAKSVWFLNIDDQECFLSHGIIQPSQAMLLDGEGIDTEFFKACSKAPQEEFIFLLIARMLWDKGVGDFVKAAQMFKKIGDLYF